MLAHLLSLKKNIIISGSHGKTTITSLVSTVLNNSKYNPTIVNGGILIQLILMQKLEKMIGPSLKQMSRMEVF